ncbi:DNA polymerase I [Sphingosinicella ginsenosidimutans]|uniref:DNA polymerase I n=1 Tax=Allosphingosinicella ginsenosidimutans TaxID=1176539 RepID=A0A5C6TSQ0_9SPHN|nr:DNA polymerase I [Sphingosinicella ginsenosidimutans]TXC63219.1 DNA polymerase I [Sphingosinicella ginsenosidimutans]
MPAPHLYLVDGSSYIFRAFHRLPPLTNKHGLNVGAVYGYTTMLWKLADSLNKADGPTHLAVILDASESTHRNELFDQYKANRPPPPPELVPQFPLIRDATRAFSIPCLEEKGLEADDIIACYVMAAKAAGWQVTIVSSDKDLMQLVEDGKVDMLDTMNDRRIGVPEVFDKFGVGPDQVGEVLALMGDSVDNVPGVPGIGPKTASKLIQEYGTVEAVLAAAPEMKPSKMRDNLIAHADMARLSHQLVRLVCDAALPAPLEDLSIKGIPEAPLREFLEHHGFRSLLARLGAQAQAAAPAPARSALPEPSPEPAIDRSLYETVADEAALARWIDAIQARGLVAIDTETDGRDCVSARLVGISLATDPNKACYIPLEHGGDDMFAERPPQLDAALVLERLKPLLEDEAILKIGHNLKYDWVVFARRGITLAPYDDTLVMSFNLDAGGLNSHALDDLAKKHLDHECISFKSLCGTGQKQITFDRVPVERATEYAAEDADVALRLWHRFRPRLAFEKVTRVYELVDRPMVSVIGGMEQSGVRIDRAVLSELSAAFNTQIADLEARIHAEADGPFTIGSPQQLGEILFGRMGLSGGRKGKSGTWSTDQNELERLEREGVPIARLVLEWRQLTKLKSTYTDALQEQVNKTTGRVHTSYSLSGAQTGRLASTDPNLMNIPIRTEIGRRIRDAFIADPGFVMMAADYSQIELRLAAHMCDVPELKAAFAAGEDIHNRTAQELFGAVDRDTRARAKTINFAILYGISRWGLAQRLETTPEEAQSIIDRYFERFPGIRAYIGETLTHARESGFTTTLFGRKTHFPRLRSNVQHERQGAERAAINAPIQGTAADIIKRAMARMGPALAAEGLGEVRMLMQVHDELVFEVPENDVDRARDVVRRVMESAAEPAVKLSVPLGVEVGVGPNWGAAH